MEKNYLSRAADTRPLEATSFAYKTISASITDMWAFWKIFINIYILMLFKSLLTTVRWIDIYSVNLDNMYILVFNIFH